MSTQIDFNDPSLFGVRNGGRPQQGKRIWPWIVLPLCLVVAGGLILSRNLTSTIPNRVDLLKLPDVASRQSVSDVPEVSVGVPSISSSSRRWCNGDEVICTTAVSGKPADTLHKLILALPKATAKRYEIRLSVTALEEPAAEQTAATSSDNP